MKNIFLGLLIGVSVAFGGTVAAAKTTKPVVTAPVGPATIFTTASETSIYRFSDPSNGATCYLLRAGAISCVK